MKKILFALVAIILGFSLFAQDELLKKPNPQTLVTDYAQVFSKTEKAQLERKLVDFFASTSTQIAVVTVPDLQGYAIADYAVRVGHEWGVGGGEFDNGIMVMMKPKTAESRGEIYIAVGYGLEAVVPDAIAKQIIENEVIPRFKAGDMYGGIDQATTVLIELSKGEYNYQQYAKNAQSSGGFNPFVLIILIFFVFPILFGRRKRGMYSAGGKGSSLPFWLALGLLGGSSRNHSGMFKDFSGGSGSFGSFGGFGGGGFGGGGAGGSW